MARKYLRIHEVIEICDVDEKFVLRLEEEAIIHPVIQHAQKLYPIDQVDRIRVARVLLDEMRVNWEGVEVALHMREQMISMQRRFDRLMRQMKKRLEE